MADKKDTTKETKSSDKKTAAKSPKAPVKSKAPAKESKKAPKTTDAVPTSAAEKAAPERIPVPRLRQRYHDVVVPAMMKEFQYKNPMQAPKLVKVVLNVGMGEAISNAKSLDHAADELGKITG